MLRLIALLLLCSSKTLLRVSGSGNFYSDEERDAPFILKLVTDDDGTPTGVGYFNPSGNADEKQVLGKETNTLVQGAHEPQSPSEKSFSLLKKVERDGRGTPIDQLFANNLSSNEVSPPKTSNTEFTEDFDHKTFAIGEETEEELDRFEYDVKLGHTYDEDDWPIDVNELLLENEARRNDQLNSLIEDLSEISSDLESAQISRKLSPIAVTESFVDHVKEVLVEDASSSESETEGDYYVKSADGRKYIRVSTRTTSKAPKLKPDDRFEGLMEFVDPSLNVKEVQQEEEPVALPPAQIKSVNVMDYTEIGTIAHLSLAERMSLIIALHDQIRNSTDFKSEIKLEDLPSAVFMFKISLIVRSRRNKLLTLTEMRNDGKLLKAILKSGMGLLDLIEVAEYLKRADRDELSDEIISEKIIPHVLELHRSRNVGEQQRQTDENAEKQKKEVFDKCAAFMHMLTTYGRVLVLNDLLNDRCVGKILRANIGVHEIGGLVETLITNGSLSDEEVHASVRLLLKGADSKEFKIKKGAYLVAVCQKYGRKGRLIKALSA